LSRKKLKIAQQSKIHLLLWSVSDLLSGARRLAPAAAKRRPSASIHPAAAAAAALGDFD